MNFPQEFTDYTRKLMGEKLYADFICEMNFPPRPFIRVNPFKSKDYQLKVDHLPILWCPMGKVLHERPVFTFDPLFHAGLYYVQEASSMFLFSVLEQYVKSPVTMLDMCAAPGGKSTLSRVALPEGSILLCNEPMRARAQVLSENIQKCGHSSVLVTNNMPSDFRKLKYKFDVVLCDVPCSGEGMFRKEENSIGAWSRENVVNCSMLQREIVSEAWSILKPGGILIYSTCTFNTKENEENVKWLQREYNARILPVKIHPDMKIAPSMLSGFDESVYRFIPGYDYAANFPYGEGLFMAVLQKPKNVIEEDAKLEKKEKKGKKAYSKSNLSDYYRYVAHPEFFDFFESDKGLVAIPKTMTPLYLSLKGKMNILHAGISIGEIKGRNFIPNQSLALSLDLNKKAFPIVEISYQQAIAYLRKEALSLPLDLPRGVLLLSYMNMPLGFVKNIGNRANNLYPQEWRIKTTYLPSEELKIFELS